MTSLGHIESKLIIQWCATCLNVSVACVNRLPRVSCMNFIWFSQLHANCIFSALSCCEKQCERHYCEVLMGATASQITSLMIVYSTVHSGADQRKHQSSASLAFVRGIPWWPVNSLHKGPVTWKMIPSHDVIMSHHTWTVSGDDTCWLSLWCAKCVCGLIAYGNSMLSVFIYSSISQLSCKCWRFNILVRNNQPYRNCSAERHSNDLPSPASETHTVLMTFIEDAWGLIYE